MAIYHSVSAVEPKYVPALIAMGEAIAKGLGYTVLVATDSNGSFQGQIANHLTAGWEAGLNFVNANTGNKVTFYSKRLLQDKQAKRRTSGN
jgi:hypothetical protein